MDVVSDILRKALQHSAEFSIMRWMRRQQIQTSLVDGTPKSFDHTTFEGVSCRSLVKGSWGFSSTTDISRAEEVVHTSERLASIPSLNREGINLAPAPPVTDQWSPHIDTSVTVWDIESVYDLAKEVDYTLQDIPCIASCGINILIITDEKVTVTSEGTCIQQTEPRIIGTVRVVAKDAGKILQRTGVMGGEYGLEILENGKFSQFALDLAKKTVKKLGATFPPSGKSPVVLSGDVVGLLVHEAVGHAAEADIALNESFLSHKIGDRITSPAISIVDDATYPGGMGTIGYDDEGVPAQNTTIIQNGILKSYLHSRETAFPLHTHSTGNARAWLFSREPTVRMTNTYVLPQDMSLEELLQQVKNGFYLSGDEGGSADRNGQFVFITAEARRIENGELTDHYFMGPTVAGDALQALCACTGVGDETTFVLKPTVCSKVQSAFVGSGGPALATELDVK